MNLTLTQSFHRTQTLSGELKAAESALTDCEADAKAKERIASIAAEAVEKAKGHLEALRQEREELAEHMAALVRRTGEALELEQIAESANCSEGWGGTVPLKVDPAFHPEIPALNSIFNEPADFQAQALAKSVENMNGAYDEATR